MVDQQTRTHTRTQSTHIVAFQRWEFDVVHRESSSLGGTHKRNRLLKKKNVAVNMSSSPENVSNQRSSSGDDALRDALRAAHAPLLQSELAKRVPVRIVSFARSWGDSKRAKTEKRARSSVSRDAALAHSTSTPRSRHRQRPSCAACVSATRATRAVVSTGARANSPSTARTWCERSRPSSRR